MTPGALIARGRSAEIFEYGDGKVLRRLQGERSVPEHEPVVMRAVRAAGYPASVSQSAGTFVCNHVFYGLQHRLAGRGVKSGFMHIPYLPEQAARQADKPSLPLPLLVEGTRLALRIALETETDLREQGGTIA